MAKITRKNQKIFASNAGANGITEYGTPASGSPSYSTDPDNIQTTDWETGWSAAALAGSEIPTFQDFNGIHYTLSYNVAYLLQEGIAEWNTATEYHQNSIVKKTGTYELYGSKTNNNTGNALPSQADNTDWQYLGALDTSVTNNGTPADNELVTYDGTSGGIVQPSGFVMPTSDGSANQVLATDGSGVLGFITALRATASSLTTNGYLTLSNGLILQWGKKGSSATAGSTVTFTYPTAFSTATLFATAIRQNSGSTNDSINMRNAPSTTAATFVLGGSNANDVWYFAIGI